jgi:hypothetical protein
MSSRSIGVTKVELRRWMMFVGDPVALLLGLEDLPRELALVGPGAHHRVEQARRLEGVPAALDEEIEEAEVAGEQRQPSHRRILVAARRPTRGDFVYQPAAPASCSAARPA